MQDTQTSVLIVIPTLNEAAHIGGLISWLLPMLERLEACLVVADGGSTDGTREIVTDLARQSDRVVLLPNPGRLQGAGVNLAVERFAGAGTRWLIRIDAHASYPPDFCDVLLAEAQRHGADSVVVGMTAVGTGFWQRAIALAQNSRFGNGGAAHRVIGGGRWVEHGHHALFDLQAFNAVGGYDAEFSHNEDAELDLRLAEAGRRIWLTGLTRVLYVPRATPERLAVQYFRFGKGRARTFRKHRQRLRARQAVLLALGPLLALGILWPLSPVFLVPVGLWLLACLGAGLLITMAVGDWRGLAAGVMAGLMQASWSFGFWRGLLAGTAARSPR
ncbi:glycosyltransferase family 2 protein [Rubellimicrobium rubrum]|uniref:Glycosyltransferase family 2 protein n=1 Tax=Rubellimicrobium rubrum TaxID=2585369 RepID=A0A5C4MUU3_9RHOB|nr:glycosyltransferase family 2 protein [Rubellimicrobium rubrum]TNC49150.1 glycosyltransferase family 2 protein [Rubellimicrobium rubrum]